MPRHQRILRENGTYQVMMRETEGVKRTVPLTRKRFEKIKKRDLE